MLTGNTFIRLINYFISYQSTMIRNHAPIFDDNEIGLKNTD